MASTTLFKKTAAQRLVLLIPALVACCCLTAADEKEPAPRPEPSPERYLSLKGKPEDRDDLKLFGPKADESILFEPEGLRIKLPAGSKERPETGLLIPMPGRGDFEVTVRYEILSEPTVAAAAKQPTKLLLRVCLERKDWTVAGLARRVVSDKGVQLTTWTIREKDEVTGQKRPFHREYEALAKVGQMRIVRTGSEASFFVAEGPDAEFKSLFQCPFGDEDLRSIELIGATGSPKTALDVRFTDLRVRMGSALATPDPTPAPPEPQAHRSTRLLFPILAGVLLILTVGVLVVLVSRRARPEQQAADTGSEADESAQATEPIAFQCLQCDKPLKVRAELAGKKIKCPGCGQSVRVPPPSV
jgi:hypothetical protein